ALLLPRSGTQRFVARRDCDPQSLRPWRPHLLRFALAARLRPPSSLERRESAAVGRVRAQMGAKSCRAAWAAHLSRFPVGACPGELRRPAVPRVRRPGSATAVGADRSTRSAIGPDRERAAREPGPL